MAQQLPTTPGRQRVVVVEDEDEIRDLETFLLAAEGYQVVGVADGEAALDTIKHDPADLLVLDLMLPGKDGNAVLAEMQQDPTTARVPVVVVSAYPGLLRTTPQVKRVVIKPFEITDLLDAVSRALAHGPSR